MRKLLKYAVVTAVLMLGTVIYSHAQDNTVIIEMTNIATYQPAEIVVRKGEKITWKNNSDQIQTITVKTELTSDKQIAYHPDEAEPFSSGAIRPGETFSYTFYIPGAYEFVSLPNEEKGMQSRIIVED
jgi:plastocyanin